MKILLIGASGIIGTAIHQALAGEHEIVTANHSSGDHRIDFEDPASIEALFGDVGPLDAIICAAGTGEIRPLDQMSEADHVHALEQKLLGQVRVLRHGRAVLRPGGSVTFTSGAAAQSPLPGTAAISAACAAVDGFVRAAALELKEIRLNVVSPAFVKESMALMGLPTDGGVSAADTAKVYLSALHGEMHGAVLATAPA